MRKEQLGDALLEKTELAAWLSERTGLSTEELESGAPLFTSGALDSFDLVEIVVFVEKHIGKRIPALAVNMENFDTVDSILRTIRK